MSPDTDGILSHEKWRMALAEDLVYELTRSAGMAYLAAYGIRAYCAEHVPDDWVGDAMIYATSIAQDIAERMASLIRNEPCRWEPGQTDEEKNAVDVEVQP